MSSQSTGRGGGGGGIPESTGLASVTAGRFSPNGKHRHSPNGRGRSSPSKERGSPNRDRGGGGSTSVMPVGELAAPRSKRLSLADTTDEESITYDDGRGFARQRRYASSFRNGYQSSLGYYDNHHYGNDSEQSGQTEWTSTFPRSTPRNRGMPGEGGPMEDRRRTDLHLKQASQQQLHEGQTRTPDVVPSAEREPVKGVEEAILKQLESTIMKSKNFVQKLNELAQSGSSDQDSDSEPSDKRKELPPQVQEELIEHVRAIMAPSRLDMIVVKLTKDSGADLGFSVSDGLVEPGVYVKSVKPGSSVDERGLLLPFDRIIKVCVCVCVV